MLFKPEMRTDEHHLDKHQRILTMIKEQDIHLVFLGDSLTRRWEDNADLWEKFFSQYKPVNFGVGADTLENIYWRVQNGEMEGINPKILIFLGGTNNLGKDSPQRIAEGIGCIIETIKIKLPHTKIVVLGLLPRDKDETGIDYKTKIKEVNGILAQAYGGTDILFEDIGPRLLNKDNSIDRTIMDDGLHLNHQGYETVGPILKEIIDSIWK